MSDRQRVELTPEEDRENNHAVIAHVIPFAIWLTLMVWLGDPHTWKYAARTFGGIVLLLICRPWRWYPRLNLKNIPAAVGVGVLIFFVWIGLETPWMETHAPSVMEWYDKLFVDLTKPLETRQLYDIGDGVMAPYKVIQEGEHSGLHVYDPKVTGWFSFWIHMVGTSVVIAIIEEFFFRGFLYRWMQGSPFFKIDAGTLRWSILLLISAFSESSILSGWRVLFAGSPSDCSISRRRISGPRSLPMERRTSCLGCMSSNTTPTSFGRRHSEVTGPIRSICQSAAGIHCALIAHCGNCPAWPM